MILYTTFLSKQKLLLGVLGDMEKLAKDDRITVLALSWRDVENPLGGGAEIHTHEMLSRLDPEKFRVIHFSPLIKGLESEKVMDNVRYIRKGGVFSVIWHAFVFYGKNRKNIDVVIDQCNTHRFFTPFWVKRNKRIFYTHQLCRELWDYMMPKPFNWIGKAIETPLLKLYRKDTTITVSESTKKELVSAGFKPENIHLVYNGLNFQEKPFEELAEKGTEPIYIYVGRFVPYKGIDASVEAFGKIKKEFPAAKLWLVGRAKEEFVSTYLKPIAEKYNLSYGESPDNDVVIWGFVSDEKKLELQEKATALLFPAQREGWGIIVIEAGAMGTPSIVYNSPGCVDAVNFGDAGYLCEKNDSDEVARLMRRTIERPEEYAEKRKRAYDYCTSFKWENNGKLLERIIVEKVKIVCDLQEMKI